MPAAGRKLSLALVVAVCASLSASAARATANPAGVLWSANPIAHHGSLHAGDTVLVTATALDAAGAAMPGAAITIDFGAASAPPGVAAGSIAVSGGSAITPYAYAGVTDSSGRVQIAYTAGGLDGGCDTLRLEGSFNYALYCYAIAARYVWDQMPKATAAYAYLAPSGTLAGGQTVNVSLTVFDDVWRPVGGAPVWINGRGPSGATVIANGVALNLTDPKHRNREFRTDAAGRVSVSYTTPSNLPGQLAVDDIRAAAADDVWLQPDEYHAMIAYRFQRVTSYTYTAGAPGLERLVSEIAPDASLAAGSRVRLVVWALPGAPLSGGVSYAPIWVSFLRSPGGGRATVHGLAMGSAAAYFVTDTAGRLTIYYDLPRALPAGGGRDVLLVQNLTGYFVAPISLGYAF